MITCQYCNIPAVRATGDKIYPHRPDLSHKRFYLCTKCGAYVGCHPGTWKELGTLANAELRAAKSAAHASFDRIWKNGTLSRRDAYGWLASALGIPDKECHIGMFDVTMCEKVLEVVRDRRMV